MYEFTDEALKGLHQEVMNIAPIPDEEWEFFRSQMRPKVVKKGEAVIRPGDPSDLFFYVHKGLVKRYFVTHDGGQVITSFDGETRVITDFYSLLKGEPASLTIECIEDAEILISKIGMPSALKARSELWRQIWQGATELRYFQEWERVRELLSLEAKDRYRVYLERYMEMQDRIPQKEVAYYIGVNPSTLNRIIKSMEAENSAN